MGVLYYNYSDSENMDMSQIKTLILNSTKKEIWVIIQDGEIFGKDMEWYDKSRTKLKWGKNCNYANEEGIKVLRNGFYSGYAWYENGVFHRYKEYQKEHIMRIIEIL